MHELSILQGMMQIVAKVAEENNLTQIDKVTLSVGKLSGAYPSAIMTAFETFIDDPLFKNTVLEIVEPPITAKCEDCEHNFEPEGMDLICPVCASRFVSIIGGRELQVEDIEGR